MFTLLSLIPTVLAQENQPIKLIPQTGSGFENLSGITIPGFISAAITLALVIAAVVFFFMLVIGGIKWIMSGGDKAQTESARNQITAALVGLVIVFAAWAIAQLIGTFFGIEIFGEFKLPVIMNTVG